MAQLRQQVLRGSFYLVGRQAVALVVSLAGVAILVRQIGPTNYGLYTAASSIVFVLASVGTFGLDVYLVRREQVVTKLDLDQAITLLLLSATVLTAGTIDIGPAAPGSLRPTSIRTAAADHRALTAADPPPGTADGFARAGARLPLGRHHRDDPAARVLHVGPRARFPRCRGLEPRHRIHRLAGVAPDRHLDGEAVPALVRLEPAAREGHARLRIVLLGLQLAVATPRPRQPARRRSLPRTGCGRFCGVRGKARRSDGLRPQCSLAALDRGLRACAGRCPALRRAVEEAMALQTLAVARSWQ